MVVIINVKHLRFYLNTTSISGLLWFFFVVIRLIQFLAVFDVLLVLFLQLRRGCFRTAGMQNETFPYLSSIPATQSLSTISHSKRTPVVELRITNTNHTAMIFRVWKRSSRVLKGFTAEFLKLICHFFCLVCHPRLAHS